jgi:hypothetical protein
MLAFWVLTFRDGGATLCKGHDRETHQIFTLGFRNYSDE